MAEYKKKPCELLLHFILSAILLSVLDKVIMSFSRTVQCLGIFNQRSPAWFLIGDWPIDAQLLAAHIKGF